MQATNDRTGTLLWAILERELASFCHLKQYKYHDKKKNKRQAIVVAMLITWLFTTTPALHLLIPSIESTLFPNFYASKKHRKVFEKIKSIEKMNAKINKLQDRRIQQNANNIEI